MSPTKRPSAIGLRKGLGTITPPDSGRVSPKDASFGVTPVRPARVTLNLPPQLYRDLTRWADDAAAALNVPRVGVQDALRAMICAVVNDGGPASTGAVSDAVLDELRERRA